MQDDTSEYKESFRKFTVKCMKCHGLARNLKEVQVWKLERKQRSLRTFFETHA